MEAPTSSASAVYSGSLVYSDAVWPMAGALSSTLVGPPARAGPAARTGTSSNDRAAVTAAAARAAGEKRVWTRMAASWCRTSGLRRRHPDYTAGELAVPGPPSPHRSGCRRDRPGLRQREVALEAQGHAGARPDQRVAREPGGLAALRPVGIQGHHLVRAVE